jgi:hypothetical protein
VRNSEAWEKEIKNVSTRATEPTASQAPEEED